MPANVATPLFRPAHHVTARATGPVIGKRFVNISADMGDDGMMQVALAGAGVASFGVAAADIATGATGLILCAGVLPVTAGGTITAGAQVEVDAAGRAVTLASGKAVGKAVESATVGVDVMVALGR